MSGLTQAVRSIRNMWGHGDDEYADNENDYQDEAEDTTPARSNTAATSYNAPVAQPTYGGGSGASGSGVRRLRSVAQSPLRAREKNIYTLRPKTQEDAAIAADALKAGDAVIINLEEVERSKAVRIIDFMSGVCYGLEGQGHAMKLGDLIFLYTPPEFEITSDETDYGENPDFFFRDVENAPQKSASANASTATVQNVGAPTVSPSPLNAQIAAQRDLRAAQALQNAANPHAANMQSSTGSPPTPPQQSSSQQSSGAQPAPQPIPQQSFSPQSYNSGERRPWER